MKEMWTYKLKYEWYDGEEGEAYVTTELEPQEFEELLLKIINGNPMKKDASKERLVTPDLFDYVLEGLKDSGCVISWYDGHTTYYIYDFEDGAVRKQEVIMKWVHNEE